MIARNMLLKVCEAGKTAMDPGVRASFEYWENLIREHHRSETYNGSPENLSSGASQKSSS